MLYQMHHQFPDGTTELKMQTGIDDKVEKHIRVNKLKEFIQKANEEFPLPLPKGVVIWRLCAEGDPRFKWTVADEPREIV